MEIEGAILIAGPRRRVWDALQDPLILRAAIPGCHGLEGNADRGFEACVARRIGPVNTRFHGRLLVTEAEPPERCVLLGEGVGAVADLVQGRAIVRLVEVDGGTHLRWEMQAALGGWLERIGAATLQPIADRGAAAFFRRMQEAIETGIPPEVAAEPRSGGTSGLLSRILARRP